MAGRLEFWRDLLRRHAVSGMTVVAFCEREWVSTAAFYNWRRRLNDDDRARQSASARPAFVPVTVAAQPSPCSVSGRWVARAVRSELAGLLSATRCHTISSRIRLDSLFQLRVRLVSPRATPSQHVSPLPAHHFR
ncbi:MAG TPA: hypothetical protein VLA12_21555 [Planctomycetaceae bacterium]|nr:hypothetical protein [Planctomycetaceae bacterium]